MVYKIYKLSNFIFKVDQTLKEKHLTITDTYFYDIERKIISESINFPKVSNQKMSIEDGTWLLNMMNRVGVTNEN